MCAPAPPPEAAVAAAVRGLAAHATAVLRAAMRGTDPKLAVAASEAVVRLTTAYLKRPDAAATLDRLASLAERFAPEQPEEYPEADPAAVFSRPNRRSTRRHWSRWAS